MTKAPAEAPPPVDAPQQPEHRSDKGLPLRARVYYAVVALATAASGLAEIRHLSLHTPGWATFLVLATCAATAQLFVVWTTKDQSYHTAIVFMVAGSVLLPPELVALMAVVQHVPEWLKLRYPWYIQSFNIFNYTLTGLGTLLAERLVAHAGGLPEQSLRALAALAACIVFVLLNHAILAAMLWLARGHHPRDSGLFSFEGLSTDLVLASLGIGLAQFWHWNPWLVPMALAPLALIHRSLHVPRLQEQARVDPKTGLFNARHFATSLTEELSRAQRFHRPLSLIMSDLDLLRDVNNTYGHLAGDAVLCGIAEVFKSELRHYDIPARFGGEEFAILLPETTLEEAMEIAERVRAAVAERGYEVETSSEPIRATVSMGVAAFPADGTDPNELVHNADLAVYRAKVQGRNRVLSTQSDRNGTPLTAGGGASEPRRRPPLTAIEGGEAAVSVSRPPAAHTHASPSPVAAPIAAVPPHPGEPVHPLAEQRGEVPALPEDERLAGDDRRHPLPSALHGPRVLALSARLAVLVGAVGALGIGGGVLGFVLGQTHDLLGLLALVAVVGGAQALALETDDGAISVSAVGALTAAALFGPRAALPLALAIALVDWSARRPALHYAVFNVSTLALASLAAAGVFQLGRALEGAHVGRHVADLGFVVAGVLAGLAYYAANMLLLALALSLETRQPWTTVLKEQFLWLLPHYVGYGVVAGVMAVAYDDAGLYALAVAAVPLLLMRRTQAAYLAHTQRSARKLRAAAETIQQQNVSLEKANRLLRERSTAAMESLSATVDARDAYTAGHSRRVESLALAIGQELGLSGQEIHLLRYAALFHDIGKIAIPDRVLLKPAKLTPDEWELMQSHAEEGARIIDRLGFLADAVPAIRHHHERFDGTGYPQRLRAEEIPLGARIIHVADALDSMLTTRIYRAGLSPEQAMAELRSGTGAQFCPRCVEALERIIPRDELDGASRPELLIAS